MNEILTLGLLLGTGFLLGEGARRSGLPKVTGYIVAGIILNPRVTGWMPEDFVRHTDLATRVSLAFIGFSVGGALSPARIRRSGRTVLTITLLEAESAFVGVALAFFALGYWGSMSWTPYALPLALVLGCMASPTDPSATLAVAHQYRARGPVTDTIMGVAALDDVLTVLNFSAAAAIAAALMGSGGGTLSDALAAASFDVLGGLAVGALSGLVLHFALRLVRGESDGALIVLVFAMLALCSGLARLAGCDEILAAMAMGAVVVSWSSRSDDVFGILERYTEELVFVLFFTIAGIRLDPGALFASLVPVSVFVAARALGKLGAALGARLSSAPSSVRRYAGFGLLPQGGIVIGLALSTHGRPALEPIADLIVGIVIGATVIHEIAGPLTSRLALTASGEIQADT